MRAMLAEGIPSQTTGLKVRACWEEDVRRERNTHLQVKVSGDGQRQVDGVHRVARR
jgi:hypothetical protein